MPEQFDLNKTIGTLSDEQIHRALQRARQLRSQTPPVPERPETREVEIELGNLLKVDPEMLFSGEYTAFSPEAIKDINAMLDGLTPNQITAHFQTHPWDLLLVKKLPPHLQESVVLAQKALTPDQIREYLSQHALLLTQVDYDALLSSSSSLSPDAKKVLQEEAQKADAIKKFQPILLDRTNFFKMHMSLLDKKHDLLDSDQKMALGIIMEDIKAEDVNTFVNDHPAALLEMPYFTMMLLTRNQHYRIPLDVAGIIRKEARNLRFRLKAPVEPKLPPGVEPPREPRPENPPPIRKYSRPWQEEFGPGTKIGTGYSAGRDVRAGVYRPQAYPELAVKVFGEDKWSECHQELEAQKAMQGLRHVVNLVGYRYDGDPARARAYGHSEAPENYLVKEFVDSEIMLEKILLAQNPTKVGETLSTALTPEDTKQVAAWLISGMEGLAEIHRRGFIISDFKFSDWPWDRQNKRMVIIDLGNAINTRDASYNREATEQDDTNDLLKSFFLTTKLGRAHMGGIDIKIQNTGAGNVLDGALTWPISNVIEILKAKTQEPSTLGSLKRLVRLMEEELDYRVNATALTPKRNFAAEYAQAMKNYFTEVGLYP